MEKITVIVIKHDGRYRILYNGETRFFYLSYFDTLDHRELLGLGLGYRLPSIDVGVNQVNWLANSVIFAGALNSSCSYSVPYTQELYDILFEEIYHNVTNYSHLVTLYNDLKDIKVERHYKPQKTDFKEPRYVNFVVDIMNKLLQLGKDKADFYGFSEAFDYDFITDKINLEEINLKEIDLDKSFDGLMFQYQL